MLRHQVAAERQGWEARLGLSVRIRAPPRPRPFESRPYDPKPRPEAQAPPPQADQRPGLGSRVLQHPKMKSVQWMMGLGWGGGRWGGVRP